LGCSKSRVGNRSDWEQLRRAYGRRKKDIFVGLRLPVDASRDGGMADYRDRYDRESD
jgi:hypothetical protein